ACQRAGVACVGLLSGGISTAELREAGAVKVFAGPAELLAAFPGSLLGELPGAFSCSLAAVPGASSPGTAADQVPVRRSGQGCHQVSGRLRLRLGLRLAGL